MIVLNILHHVPHTDQQGVNGVIYVDKHIKNRLKYIHRVYAISNTSHNDKNPNNWFVILIMQSTSLRVMQLCAQHMSLVKTVKIFSATHPSQLVFVLSMFLWFLYRIEGYIWQNYALSMANEGVKTIGNQSGWRYCTAIYYQSSSS